MEMLLMGLMLAASPMVSSPIHSGVVAASGGVEIRSLIVLGADVDRGLVGLKVVTTAKAYEQTDNSTGASEHVKPTNCLYAGMSKTPFDGVMLALLRSGAKDPDEWEVYAAALDGSYNGARCTPPAVSKERLAQAKAAFAKANLPNAVHVVTVLADDKPVFVTWGEFEAAYAGRATYELLGAFVSGTKVMLLQQFSEESGMKGPSESSTHISLSPVLDLAP